MIEGKAIIEPNSLKEIFIEDIRGYKRIKLSVMDENVVWGKAHLYGGFAKEFTDHAFKTQKISRESLNVFDITPGYHFIKLKVFNASYTLPMELVWKLDLS